MDDMAITEAQRRAKERYLQTERGQEVQRQAQKKYAETPSGRSALKKASLKFEAENAEARREYKRLKAREYRLRAKKQNPEQAS